MKLSALISRLSTAQPPPITVCWDLELPEGCCRGKASIKALIVHDETHPGQNDDSLWRNSWRSSYWEKEKWMIPIFHAGSTYGTVGHWMLAIIDRPSKNVLIFDSMASRDLFEQYSLTVFNMVERLMNLCAKNSKLIMNDGTSSARWTSQPVIKDACQTNGYDCGVWVLATVSALVREDKVGTDLQEKDIQGFRGYLLSLIFQHCKATSDITL
ncbi:cysteine proteinase [Coniophora puteana RWD-64-598 SS2]|uniref:Cysteine proteinase n=1 Tax=Coniophora puteana (strain RWD-64-598) TaxID=741705 RepID=R7SE61_CONPW|nr:cysteine proteinase [Coniophora puteana RWD-64-598 SS2]EIW74145.1 cysteine proteinase [Coniophora puteana RWD-64-598 SS2]